MGFSVITSPSHNSSSSSIMLTICADHCHHTLVASPIKSIDSVIFGSSVESTSGSYLVGSPGAEACVESISVVVSITHESTVSPGFLSQLLDENASTATQHANTPTHIPINTHILPFHHDAGTFCGDAFELSE